MKKLYVVFGIVLLNLSLLSCDLEDKNADVTTKKVQEQSIGGKQQIPADETL